MSWCIFKSKLHWIKDNMMLYSAVSFTFHQKGHWRKVNVLGGWSNCLCPSQRVGWFWEVYNMTGNIYFLFSSPEAGNPGVGPTEHPPFRSPLASLSQTHPYLLVLTHTAGGMLSFLRGAVQPVTVSRARDIVQKRNSSIYSKPPKNKIGPGVSEMITKS